MMDHTCPGGGLPAPGDKVTQALSNEDACCHMGGGASPEACGPTPLSHGHTSGVGGGFNTSCALELLLQ